MALLHNTLGELERLYEEMNRAFGLFDSTASVPVDILETPEEVIIQSDVPGIEKKDLDITVHNQSLTLKGTRKGQGDHEKTIKDESWTGSFQRTLPLPKSVNPDSIQAELKNGLLTIRIGKRAESKPRQIAINVQ